jgi:predicted RNA-binding Zn ribbon-like protein
MGEQPEGPLFFTGDDPMSVAADLLNTIDLLATPADRLTELRHLRMFLDGHSYPARPVRAGDLETVSRLREQLRAVWQADDLALAADRLNVLLSRHRPVPRLRLGPEGPALEFGDRTTPVRTLLDDVLGALLQELAAHGTARLGTCVGDPCRCVFLDRSRNRARRYCCEICTNRAAAAAFRRRGREARRPG